MSSHVEDVGHKSFVNELVLLSALEASETSTQLSRAQMPSVEGNVPFYCWTTVFYIQFLVGNMCEIYVWWHLSFTLNKLYVQYVAKEEQYCPFT